MSLFIILSLYSSEPKNNINYGNDKNRKKFKTTVKQTNPTNPSGYTKNEINNFDIDKKTIKKQQNKTHS